MDHGIFPNVTYGNTTSKNAMEICDKLSIPEGQREIFEVTRCYQTRHGHGWMSNTKPIQLINNQEEINVYNEWQTNFKIAELDYELLNYALTVEKNYSRGIRKNLVMTCLDQRPDFQLDIRKLEESFSRIIKSYSPFSKDMVSN